MSASSLTVRRSLKGFRDVTTATNLPTCFVVAVRIYYESDIFLLNVRLETKNAFPKADFSFDQFSRQTTLPSMEVPASPAISLCSSLILVLGVPVPSSCQNNLSKD